MHEGVRDADVAGDDRADASTISAIAMAGGASCRCPPCRAMGAVVVRRRMCVRVRRAAAAGAVRRSPKNAMYSSRNM